MFEILNGFCRDCGNGTLNNKTNPQFSLVEDGHGHEVVACNACGSTRVDAAVDFGE